MNHPEIPRQLPERIIKELQNLFENGTTAQHALATAVNHVATCGGDYLTNAGLLQFLTALQQAAADLSHIVYLLDNPAGRGYPLPTMKRRRAGIHQAIGYLKVCLWRFEACETCHHPVSLSEIPGWIAYLQTILDAWPLGDAAACDESTAALGRINAQFTAPVGKPGVTPVAVPAKNTDHPVDPQHLHNILLLVDVEAIRVVEVATWPSDWLKLAAKWARAKFDKANDNDDVVVPPCPFFVPPEQTAYRLALAGDDQDRTRWYVYFGSAVVIDELKSFTLPTCFKHADAKRFAYQMFKGVIQDPNLFNVCTKVEPTWEQTKARDATQTSIRPAFPAIMSSKPLVEHDFAGIEIGPSSRVNLPRYVYIGEDGTQDFCYTSCGPADALEHFSKRYKNVKTEQVTLVDADEDVSVRLPPELQGSPEQPPPSPALQELIAAAAEAANMLDCHRPVGIQGWGPNETARLRAALEAITTPTLTPVQPAGAIVSNAGKRLELHLFPERELSLGAQAYLHAAAAGNTSDDVDFNEDTVVSFSGSDKDDLGSGAYVLGWYWVGSDEVDIPQRYYGELYYKHPDGPNRTVATTGCMAVNLTHALTFLRQRYGLGPDEPNGPQLCFKLLAGRLVNFQFTTESRMVKTLQAHDFDDAMQFVRMVFPNAKPEQLKTLE